MEFRQVLEALSGREPSDEELETYAKETEAVRRDWMSGIGG